MMKILHDPDMYKVLEFVNHSCLESIGTIEEQMMNMGKGDLKVLFDYQKIQGGMKYLLKNKDDFNINNIMSFAIQLLQGSSNSNESFSGFVSGIINICDQRKNDHEFLNLLKNLTQSFPEFGKQLYDLMKDQFIEKH